MNDETARRRRNSPECREREREYRKANKAVLNARSAAWRQANPERIKANNAAWNAANKESISIKAAARYRADPASHLARNRRWQVENKERFRALVNAWRRERDRLKADTVLTAAERRQVIAIYRMSRVISRMTGIEHHVDHHIPLAKGGDHHPRNLWVIPASENLAKGARVP